MENEYRMNGFESSRESDKFGYIFVENGIPQPHFAVGHELVINLTEQPTYKHFDPKRVEAKIFEPSNRVVYVKRFGIHPEMNLCYLSPGPLRLVDQNEDNHKDRVFYTYGGSMVPHKYNHSGMSYEISSNAPIIELSTTPVSDEIRYWQQLGEISEAEFAKIRAHDLEKHQTINTELFLYPQKIYHTMIRQILTQNHISPSFRAWLETKTM